MILPEIVGTVTASVRFSVTAPLVAVMVTEPGVVTVPRVVTWKVAEVAPAGTVTDKGTVANNRFEEVSWTTVPLVGAGLVRVTVPVTE